MQLKSHKKWQKQSFENLQKCMGHSHFSVQPGTLGDFLFHKSNRDFLSLLVWWKCQPQNQAIWESYSFMKDAAWKGAQSQPPNGKSVTGTRVLDGASQNKSGGNTAALADKIGLYDLDTFVWQCSKPAMCHTKLQHSALLPQIHIKLMLSNDLSADHCHPPSVAYLWYLRG